MNAIKSIGAGMLLFVCMLVLFGGGVILGAAQAPTRATATQAVRLDPDQTFLTILATKNVGVTGPADAVTMGHRVCDALTQEKVNRWMEGTRLVSLGYSGDEAATIVGASVVAYCPAMNSSYDNQTGY